MRVFKTTYKARNGKTKEAQKWYVEFRDQPWIPFAVSCLRQQTAQRRVLAFRLALPEQLL